MPPLIVRVSISDQPGDTRHCMYLSQGSQRAEEPEQDQTAAVSGSTTDGVEISPKCALPQAQPQAQPRHSHKHSHARNHVHCHRCNCRGTAACTASGTSQWLSRRGVSPVFDGGRRLADVHFLTTVTRFPWQTSFLRMKLNL